MKSWDKGVPEGGEGLVVVVASGPEVGDHHSLRVAPQAVLQSKIYWYIS